MRVRLAPAGDFAVAGHGADAHEEPFSYAIDAGRTWPLRDIEVEDRGASLSVTTAGLRLVVAKEPVRLRFETPDGRVILEDDAGASPAEAAVDGLEPVHASFRMQPEAHFFGLGEKCCPLDKRDTALHNWNHDSAEYEPYTDPLYQTHPFFIVLNGGQAYGVFFDNTYRSYFDLGKTSRTSYSFGANGGEMNYYFIPGPTPADVIRRYSKLVGTPPLPAAGNWETQLNWNNNFQAGTTNNVSPYAYYQETAVIGGDLVNSIGDLIATFAPVTVNVNTNLDTLGTSGTTPAAWQANRVPVRPKPVKISSKISSSWKRSAARRSRCSTAGA